MIGGKRGYRTTRRWVSGPSRACACRRPVPAVSCPSGPPSRVGKRLRPRSLRMLGRAGPLPTPGRKARAGDVGAGGSICRLHRAWAGSGGAESGAAGAPGYTVATAAAPRLEEDDEERRKRRGGTLLRGAGFRVRGRLRSLRAGLSKCGAGLGAAVSRGRGGRPAGASRERGATRPGPCGTGRSPLRSLAGRGGRSPNRRRCGNRGAPIPDRPPVRRRDAVLEGVLESAVSSNVYKPARGHHPSPAQPSPAHRKSAAKIPAARCETWSSPGPLRSRTGLDLRIPC